VLKRGEADLLLVECFVDRLKEKYCEWMRIVYVIGEKLMGKCFVCFDIVVCAS
jgi:hypothetical protein